MNNNNYTTSELLISNMPGIITNMVSFLPWLGVNSCLTVRFEEILTDPDILYTMGEYLGLPLTDNHFERLWGGTQTFTGELSKWQDHWNEEINSAWVNNGGIELESDMDYDSNRKYERCVNG